MGSAWGRGLSADGTLSLECLLKASVCLFNVCKHLYVVCVAGDSLQIEIDSIRK